MADTYFFIHLPKTGGMSLAKLLSETFPPDRICPYYFEQDFLAPTFDPTRYRLYAGHHSYFLTTVLPSDTKVITFLRHPVARAMSTYEHILHNQQHPRHKLLVEQTHSLADFARHPFLGQQICNTQTRALGRSLDYKALRMVAAVGPDFLERAKIFVEIFRTLQVTAAELAMAKERLNHMAFVGLTEKFEESCKRLFSLRDISIWKIPRINDTPAEVAGRRDQYSAEDLAAVTEANALDLELYDHAVRLFDSAGRRAAGSPQ